MSTPPLAHQRATRLRYQAWQLFIIGLVSLLLVTSVAEAGNEDGVIQRLAAKDPAEDSNTNSPKPSTCRPSALQRRLMKLHNEARTKPRRCGRRKFPSAQAVVWSCELEKAATAHSRDMFKRRKMSHRGSDGSSLKTRINRTRFVWRALGENIANGFSSARSVNAAWLDSKGHCSNIMNNSYNRMGAARVGDYWTVVFGLSQ